MMSFAYTKENIRYAHPLTTKDPSIYHNHTFENYFDVDSMEKELASFKPPDNLYDAVARAWDSRYYPYPHGHNRQLSRSFARVMKNSPYDMGSPWDRPGYDRPRRSSYEERRGAVPVKPSEVNALAPDIPCPPDFEEDSPAPQPTSASSTIDHSSDADDELDDCGYSSEGTMTWQPHAASTHDLSALQSYPLDFSSTSDDADDSFASDTESDISLSPPPRSTPTPTSTSSSNNRIPDMSDILITTKQSTGSSAPPKRSTRKSSKYLSDRRQANPIIAKPRSSLSSDAFTSDDAEYEPSPLSSSSFNGSSSSRKQTSFPCFLDGCNHICSTSGDLVRHRQSLRHRAPEYSCLGCYRSFTRPDALKRHLNGRQACRRSHPATLVASGNF